MNLTELMAKMHKPLPPLNLEPERTALILIDIQLLAGGEWIVEEAVHAGVPQSEAEQAVAELDARLNAAAKNAQRVLEACRKAGIRPIHVKIEAMTEDAKDVGPLHKLLNFRVKPGSKWAEFFPDVRPAKGEIILTKTCSGAFTGTHLDLLLRNLGVTEVVIVGFYTDQCIETAARDSADIGYDTLVVTDACAAQTVEGHRNTFKAIGDVYVRMCTTDEFVARLT